MYFTAYFCMFILPTSFTVSNEIMLTRATLVLVLLIMGYKMAWCYLHF